MKKTFYLIPIMAMVFGLTSCKKELPSNSEIETQSISAIKNLPEDFPFADSLTLKSFDSESAILNYEYARKLSMVELLATGKIEEMKWSGCRLSEFPVVIYGFDSKPKFYEFIVFDPEQRAIGAVTAYARKKSSTIIREITPNVPDFGNKITKNGNGRLIQDWKGNAYIGVPSKSGDAPTAVIDENGQLVSGVTELTDEQIVSELSKTVLVDVKRKNDSLYQEKKDSLQLLPNGDQLQELYTQPLSNMVDSLQSTMVQEQKETAYYWEQMAVIQDSIDLYGDDELIEKSTKGLFGRIFRRIFSGVDETRFALADYHRNRRFRIDERGDWCGPWVASYIYNTKKGGDHYNYFESCASTTGMFIGWAFRLGESRPMFPDEFAWSMAWLSRGSILINPYLKFPGNLAYDHIRHGGNPVIRMCWAGGDLHWTLAYGTYQTGNYFWRNYYFLQTENGAKFGREPKGDAFNVDTTHSPAWSQMDWYMPFLLVHD